MLLLVDNYDSFSYNLYQLIGAVRPDIRVIRNDVCTVDEIRAMAPEAIFISPGPGRPEDAGICVEMIQKLGSSIPMFGVCLGHQAICQAYGATVTYAKELMHGKKSRLLIEPESILFQGLSSGMTAARYHSLSVKEDTLPETLRVTARTPDGEVMAVEHREYPVYGVQFHPESVMTPDGLQVVKNFVNQFQTAAK
ncbi:MAG: aminodeoxychorismate/anthranilate synthase component II [Lachnospiraceae bacterium]|nr:aminodeoxychorismate/anthranilate synthase component II [Lachnospiraceae bacterium]